MKLRDESYGAMKEKFGGDENAKMEAALSNPKPMPLPRKKKKKGHVCGSLPRG